MVKIHNFIKLDDLKKMGQKIIFIFRSILFFMVTEAIEAIEVIGQIILFLMSENKFFLSKFWRRKNLRNWIISS